MAGGVHRRRAVGIWPEGDQMMKRERGVKVMPLALWISIGAAILCAVVATRQKK